MTIIRVSLRKNTINVLTTYVQDLYEFTTANLELLHTHHTQWRSARNGPFNVSRRKVAVFGFITLIDTRLDDFVLRNVNIDLLLLIFKIFYLVFIS